MTLPSSGSMTYALINTELGNSNTTQLSIGNSTPRTLAGVSSGAIRVAADFYGKTRSYTVNFLLVAGGGGGGAQTGGGGGGGGYLTGTASLTYGTAYNVVIGAGGAYGYQGGGTSWGYNGQNGYNSTFNGVTSYGGGGGISANGWPYNDYGNASNLGPNGLLTTNGGSGGGAGTSSRGYTATGTGVEGQGYSYTATPGIISGGAGAGGTNPSSPNAGKGGPGAYSSLSGSSTAYAGGGGGGGTNFSGTQYPGGVGGGGTGNTRIGQPGTQNSGGGGGGGGQSGSGALYRGGTGGSGICILTHPDYLPTASTTGSPTITIIGGYKIYTFTGSGSITFDNLGTISSYSYRYVKWTITAVRSSGYGTQASDFCLQYAGTDIGGMSSSTVTSTGSITGGEEPQKLVDNDINTKWFTGTNPTLSVTFDLGSTKVFNGYRWSTGDDMQERDPISWTISGSNDGSTYTTLHTVTSASITTDRSVLAGNWQF